MGYHFEKACLFFTLALSFVKWRDTSVFRTVACHSGWQNPLFPSLFACHCNDCCLLIYIQVKWVFLLVPMTLLGQHFLCSFKPGFVFSLWNSIWNALPYLATTHEYIWISKIADVTISTEFFILWWMEEPLWCGG